MNKIIFYKKDLEEFAKSLDKADSINMLYRVYNKFFSKETKMNIREYHKRLKKLNAQARKVFDLAETDYYKTKLFKPLSLTFSL